MRRLLLVATAAALIGCAPPVINPPPVPPPVTYVLREIFWSSTPDPSGVHGPREPHSCAIKLGPASESLHDYYEPVDKYWLNGWEFWTNCVIPARTLGRALPVVKITGDGSDPPPVLTFHLDTAPVLGLGSGHYDDPVAAAPAVWRKARIEAVNP
ncbi:MAG TPA: hypothetical protein VNC22_22935 [Sporichthya sp.]|jgi:hypothetical protein|nr:hypothetical protein [Sporichthya sp.]